MEVAKHPPTLGAIVTVEKDSDDKEEISNLFEFLIPEKDIIENAISFGFHYNRSIFNGWVKQPSPCCAASSVAGAWNALRTIHRQDSNAISHADVLNIYKVIVQEKLQKKLSAFERKLGSSLSNSFWEEFELIAKKFGKEIGGKKGYSVTKETADKILKEIVGTYVLTDIRDKKKLEEIKSNNTTPTCSLNDRECFLELYNLEGFVFSESSLSLADDTNVEILNNEDCDDNDLLSEDGEDAPRSKSSNEWMWKTDFMEIIRTKAGLAKLEAEKPSTAFIGNWGILESVAYLSETNGFGTSISARLFMGKKKTSKSKVDIPLSKKDTPDVIARQWELLRAGLANPKQVLLLHWSNHYALIFAIREWYDRSKCYRIRHVLTAKRGQRPTVWAEFDEIRDALLSWDGYKIMAITDHSNESSNKFL